MNSTNTSLDLKVGTLSRSLLKVGGETILQELQQKYPDGITPGKIAVSAGGNLSCKEIYHGVLFKWDKGQGQAEKVHLYNKRHLNLFTVLSFISRGERNISCLM